MARQGERSPLLHFPAPASHFASAAAAAARGRGGRAGPSSASAAAPPPPGRLPPPSFVIDQSDDAEPLYSFAPHEHAVLYDEDEEVDGREGGAEDGEEEEGGAAPALRLQRVDNSGARLNGRGDAGAAPAVAAHWMRSLHSSSGAPHTATANYGSTAAGHSRSAAAAASTSTSSSSFSALTSASTSSSSRTASAAVLADGQWSSSPSSSPSSGVVDVQSGAVKKVDGSSRSPSPSSADASSSRPVVLALYLCLSVLIAAGNSITWKRTLNRFRAVDGSSANLEFFVTEWSILLYVVLAALILAYRWLCTALISDEQKAYPQTKFLAMGLMDAIAGLCSSLGGAFTSGQVQTIINQANIPVTMLLSHSFLHSRYVQRQYVGAGLIVAGSLLAVLPSSSSGEGAAAVPTHTLWYGPLILALSTLPNSLSNCYKEKNFKQDGLDVFFLTTSVSLYQVMLGFLFCPLLALPALGGISLDQIPDNFRQGWSCFLGRELRGYECHVAPYPYVVFLLYVVVNFVYNVLLLLITKHGSALLLVIASALSLPITNLLFTLPLFMGEEAEQWSWWTASGLLVVVVGFLLYSLVTDDDSGEWLPAQGAAGQVVYVTHDAAHDAHLLAHQQQRRRHSFDMTSSPLLIARADARKREARRRFREQTGRAVEGGDDGEQGDRLFFTPP